MKRRIALDVQSLFENHKTGIGWTVKKLVDNLTKNPNYQYQLNYFGCYHVDKTDEIVQEYKKRGCLIKHCIWLELPIYRRIWNLFPIPYHWMFGRQNDITQFFNYVIPPGVYGKKILFIYDMAYKAFPDTISKRTKMDLERNLNKSCERADIICTISEFSKSEIVKYLAVPESKIRVVPCGVDNQLFRTDYSADEIMQVRRKYNIPKDYFLYLGTLEPRKNVLRLVQAYSLLKKRMPESPPLVLAGKKGWLYEDIFAFIKQSELEGTVIFTGYVETKEVPILMNGAIAFTFPSLYEGFGLPVLEAMACGTPVLTSFNTSLKEIAGDACILVDPLSIEDISVELEYILNHPEIRIQLVEKGLRQSRLFTWERAAKCLESIYEEF